MSENETDKCLELFISKQELLSEKVASSKENHWDCTIWQKKNHIFSNLIPPQQTAKTKDHTLASTLENAQTKINITHFCS